LATFGVLGGLIHSAESIEERQRTYRFFAPQERQIFAELGNVNKHFAHWRMIMIPILQFLRRPYDD
jgi:hypothetical protein